MPFSWKGFDDSLEREMTKPTLDSHHPSGIRSPLRYHRILENFQPDPTSNIPESPPFLWNEDTVEINWNEYIYNTQRCDVSFHRKKGCNISRSGHQSQHVRPCCLAHHAIEHYTIANKNGGNSKRSPFMNAGNYEYVLESVLRIQRQNHPNPHMSSY